MASSLSRPHWAEHLAGTQASPLRPAARNLIKVGSRRWFLQTGAAGVAGVSMADMLRRQAQAGPAPQREKKSVIIFWLSGGPSHLDMWDPKPDAPPEIRGPYGTISTSVPGIRLCEHLPLQAKIMDKLSIIRSVDCSASNHTPITMQAGNSLAKRTDNGRNGGGYPSMGSIAARYRGPNSAEMPAFVGLAPSWVADVYGAGDLGNDYEPVKGLEVADKLTLPEGLDLARLQDRHKLRRGFDRLARSLDRSSSSAALDQYQQTALEMMVSGKVRKAFDLSHETEATKDAYGRSSIGEKGLLARRLVEAGVTYVLVSGAWGYFDHHGDEVRWFGIEKGLTPILPTVDRVMVTLVNDLADRGLLDSTLVLMMGEFGRSPVMTPTAGRGHWTNVMSMLVAGGGVPGGQVIGSTDRKGYGVHAGRVTPEDLAATVFQHLDIPLDSQWTNPQGRPIPIVSGGRPIKELSKTS